MLHKYPSYQPKPSWKFRFAVTVVSTIITGILLLLFGKSIPGHSSNLNSSGSYVPSTHVQASPTDPAKVLDLSNFTLTLPYDANNKRYEPGVTPGPALTIAQPALASFIDKHDFFVDQNSGGVVLITPVNGATTGAFSYPRTELSQTASGATGGAASWSLAHSAANSLTVEQSIDHLPTKNPQVVIAKLQNASHPVLEILADAEGVHGSAYQNTESTNCANSINQTGCKFDICFVYDGVENDSDCLINGYTIGSKYSLTITAEDSQIVVSATYSGTITTVPLIDMKPADQSGNYFTTGSYLQANIGSEGNYTDYSQVSIYSVSIGTGNTD